MEHFKAIGIKSIMTFAAVFLILGLGFQMTLGQVMILTVAISALSYPLGDLKVFPKAGNKVATLVDFTMVFGVIWLLGNVLVQNSASLIISGAIVAFAMAVGEYYFHKYIARIVLHRKYPFENHKY
ncbi:hypothetical protein GCM10007216_29040 [Thalassobacillus devorans]|uniref:DUF2512 family protein n=1 Tax=Thalassobacillus devorans TaxID=279813 RepID=A0ABQ1PFW6_9BACI|nr:DUF2512 family protein [Thalassobacillus devorans]NIK29410.1 thiol:disulfide interchange protein [Thalassobacillus devorans]GGC96441.1 hypothetical protein GCM10007216_29040 [Thalassobacillus devorans]